MIAVKHKEVLINILTRTSGRPIGFMNCHESIINQTYKNVRHIVSYENENDLRYLNKYNVVKIKVNKYDGEKQENLAGNLFAPYNSYCNILLDKVETGWIMFLDDDDSLLHNKVLEEIVAIIKKFNDDTMFIWQMRYPNGNLIPNTKFFKRKTVQINNIGSPCVIFHSKFKNIAKWDNFKGADFRFINCIYEIIPNKKWVEKVFIQINNMGDFGKRNDIGNLNINKAIFNKNIIWHLMPKYHFSVLNIKVYHKLSYLNFFKRLKNVFK